MLVTSQISPRTFLLQPQRSNIVRPSVGFVGPEEDPGSYSKRVLNRDPQPL